MAQTDWDFVFDGAFGFLVSPMWQIPVIAFIERYCEVFDPSEESRATWTDLHVQYRNLVENLLASYLKDVGITEEQFVKACNTPAVQERPQMQVVFEQILAAEDFEIFKRMMIQRNIELQLQALQLIQQRHGVPPQQQSVPAHATTEEDEILNAVLRHSKEEYEKMQQGKQEASQKFDKELEEAIAKSESESKRLREEVEKQNQEKREAVKASLTAAVTSSSNDTPQVSSSNQKIAGREGVPEPVKQQSPPKSSDKTGTEKRPLKAPKQPSSSSPKKEIVKEGPKDTAERKPDVNQKKATEPVPVIGTTISPSAASLSADDIKRREEYLKQQRDRLLAMKKREREKRLSSFTQSQPKRPASARTAREAVKETPSKEQSKSVTVDDPKKLAMRRALAERLRKEVIDKEGSF